MGVGFARYISTIRLIQNYVEGDGARMLVTKRRAPR